LFVLFLFTVFANTFYCQDSVAIANSNWQLESMRGFDSIAEKMAIRPFIAITVSPEGLYYINGNDGCNGFHSMLKLNQSEFQIEALVQTKRACINFADVSAQYIKLLLEASTYQIRDQHLLLMNSDRKTILIFTNSSSSSKR